jgi:hypothetical protein
MAKYRARHCPNCNYFVGFAIAKQLVQTQQVPVTNFCLNCNYKMPVHSIIRGISRPIRPPAWRAPLRLVQSAQDPAIGLAARPWKNEMDTKITPADYSRHLRAIGQDLENLHLSAFNLEYTGDSYLVWIRPNDQADNNNPRFRISKNRLQKLWRNKTPPRTLGQEESYASSSTRMGKRLRYSVQELDRIEREQRARRRQQSGTADGHSLSQLLRTVGDLIGQKGERLLGIAWQELSIGVVVETPQGRKEIDVYRPDNLYDLWVKMYLRRDNRALFDGPH